MFTLPYQGDWAAWLDARTFFVCKHGSHAYGLAREGSDLDLKGVAIPPRVFLCGLRDSFEQAEGRDPDLVVYGLRKFLRLAIANNPTMIED